MSLTLTDLLSPDVPVTGELHVSLPLRDLTRLRDLLLDPPGRVDVALEVYQRGDGLVLVEGRMQGAINVACQRCLEAVPIAVERDVRVALVASETATPAAEGFESWPLEDGPVTLRALLEDELLLALPLVPVHEDRDDCGELATRLVDMATEDEDAGAAAPDSPFAVLEKLKR